MMRKKNILLITLTSTLDFGTKSLGGVDSVCQDLIKSLVGSERNKYNYRILAFDPASKSQYTGNAQKLSENVSVVVAPCNEKLGGFRFPGIITQILRVRQQIKDACPDVVHVHSASWLIGVPSHHKRIATLHGYKNICRKSVSVLNNFFYINIIPWLAGFFVDQFTCVGDVLKTALKQDTKKPISIIRNPINDIFFSGHHHEIHEPIRFVTCSNLNPRKRLDRVLRLIHSLKMEGLHTQLSIIGTTGDKVFCAQIRRQVEDLGLQSEVSFLGRKSPKKIAAIYQNSDFGVFLSEEETFGLAPLEMLASGLPVIATNVGLLSEERSVFEGNGVIYYDEDQELDRIVNFLTSRDTQIKRIPQDWLLNNFSSDKIVTAYEGLYS